MYSYHYNIKLFAIFYMARAQNSLPSSKIFLTCKGTVRLKLVDIIPNKPIQYQKLKLPAINTNFIRYAGKSSEHGKKSTKYILVWAKSEIPVFLFIKFIIISGKKSVVYSYFYLYLFLFFLQKANFLFIYYIFLFIKSKIVLYIY